VERLPYNPFVELQENRLGITFEVDPSTVTIIKTVTEPQPNYFEVTMNTIILATFFYIMGNLIVGSCTRR